MSELNTKISQILRSIGVLESDKYKKNAFFKVARNLKILARDISELESYRVIPGVGASIEAVIKEVIKTGKSQRLIDLEKVQGVYRDLSDLEKIPGIGPIHAQELYQQYGVTSVKELRQMVSEGKVSDERMIKALEITPDIEKIPLEIAIKIGQKLLEHLKFIADDPNKVTFAGSIRRKKKTVGDIDIVMATKNPEEVKEFLEKAGYRIQYGKLSMLRIILPWDKKTRDCDLYLCSHKEWPCTVTYLTGSKEFNVVMRSKAKKLGCTLNQARLLNLATQLPIEIKTEKDLFNALQMEWVEPEGRN